MRDRTLGVIFTVIVVILFGLPGLACMCLGLSSFLFSGVLISQTEISPVLINGFGAFGLCVGFFLVVITVVISYLLLHQKPETPPAKPPEPMPPVTIDQPTPPSNPDEPLPPTT